MKLETQKIISAENFLRGCTILGINYKSIKMKYLPILTIFLFTTL